MVGTVACTAEGTAGGDIGRGPKRLREALEEEESKAEEEAE